MLLATSEAINATTRVVLDVPPQQLQVAILLGGMAFLVSIAAGIATVWNAIKRTPPTIESLHDFRKHVAEMYCTKADLQSCMTRCNAEATRSEGAMRAEIEHMRGDMKEIRSLFEQGIKELQRALGRVEGKLEK